MKPLPVFLRWLTFAALADWLITRTLTRAAIFMPKSPLVIAAYQAVSLAGQVASTLTGLLALGTLSWMAWRYVRTRRRLGLPFVWLSLLALSLVFLFLAPNGWLAVGYHVLLLTAIVMTGKRLLLDSKATLEVKLAGALPALALLTGGLYQIGPAVYEALQWPGPPPFTGVLFDLGELLVILSPFALWWAYGRKASRWMWLGAAFPAAAFSVMRFVNPAMTGIMAIWSTGLTLYLPWPAYAVGLWLAGLTVIVSLRRGAAAPVGWAILLLAAGGYAPQLSTHAFLGLVALWLLTMPFDSRSVAATPSYADQLPSSDVLPQSAAGATRP